MRRIIPLLLLVACSGPTELQLSERADAVARASARTLVLASPSLYGRVELTNAQTRTIGRFRSAQASILNLTSEPLPLEYQFRWVDSGGFAIQSLPAWQSVTLLPGEARPLQGVGKSVDAADFQIVVKLPGDVYADQLERK